jgi:hypothetical protein
LCERARPDRVQTEPQATLRNRLGRESPRSSFAALPSANRDLCLKRRGTRGTRGTALKPLTFSAACLVPRPQMVAGNKGNKAGRDARLLTDRLSTECHRLLILRIGWPSTTSVRPFESSTVDCRGAPPRRWPMRTRLLLSGRDCRCIQGRALPRTGPKSVPHVPRLAALFPAEASAAKVLKQQAFLCLFPMFPVFPAPNDRVENCGFASATATCFALSSPVARDA